MRAEVRPIYVRGVPLNARSREKLPASVGDLRVLEDRLHKLGRVVVCATLVGANDGLEQPLLPNIVDARLLYINDKTIRLQGNEEVDGVFFSQTWDVKVL